MRLTFTTKSEDETIALGNAIGRALLPGDVVALHGELGAGKTRLVRGMARGVGAESARVSSPTFVIMQEYRVTVEGATAGGPIGTLVHIDAYRLRGADELESIGWERVLRDIEERRPVAVVVEWAERIESALPPAGSTSSNRLDVRLEHAGESGETRAVTIEGDDAWRTRAAWSQVEKLAAAAVPPLPTRRATRCPITGKPVPPDSPTYPFFDERARLADLGRWISGSYTVSRDLLPEDESDPDFGGTR